MSEWEVELESCDWTAEVGGHSQERSTIVRCYLRGYTEINNIPRHLNLTLGWGTQRMVNRVKVLLDAGR